jgi:hypothetical protein
MVGKSRVCVTNGPLVSIISQLVALSLPEESINHHYHICTLVPSQSDENNSLWQKSVTNTVWFQNGNIVGDQMIPM